MFLSCLCITTIFYNIKITFIFFNIENTAYKLFDFKNWFILKSFIALYVGILIVQLNIYKHVLKVLINHKFFITGMYMFLFYNKQENNNKFEKN